MMVRGGARVMAGAEEGCAFSGLPGVLAAELEHLHGYYATLLPVCSVGVQGDGRTYSYVGRWAFGLAWSGR